jgi:hypothetical protein
MHLCGIHFGNRGYVRLLMCALRVVSMTADKLSWKRRMGYAVRAYWRGDDL